MPKTGDHKAWCQKCGLAFTIKHRNERGELIDLENSYSLYRASENKILCVCKDCYDKVAERNPPCDLISCGPCVTGVLVLDEQTGEYREVPLSEAFKPEPAKPPTPVELGNAVIDAVIHLNEIIVQTRKAGVEVIVNTLYYTPEGGGAVHHIDDCVISVAVPFVARVATITNSEETEAKESPNAK